MKKLLILSILLSSNVFAGYDEASTVNCKNSQWELKIKREGTFFGKNWITLKKTGTVVIDESYEQDWSPEGKTKIELIVKKEQPCSSEDFYQMLKSKNSLVIQSYTGGSWCADKGERDTTYIQLLSSNQIVKFDNKTECKK